MAGIRALHSFLLLRSLVPGPLLKERDGAATVAQERELQEELTVHRRRMTLDSRACACAATSFLLVATVVVVLFLREVQLASLALRRF